MWLKSQSIMWLKSQSIILREKNCGLLIPIGMPCKREKDIGRKIYFCPDQRCSNELEITKPLPSKVGHQFAWQVKCIHEMKKFTFLKFFFGLKKSYFGPQYFVPFLFYRCLEPIQYIQWGLNDIFQFLYLSPGVHCSRKVDIRCLCNDDFARFDGSLYDG